MPDYDDLMAEARSASHPSAEVLARVEASARQRAARAARVRWGASAGGLASAAAAAFFWFQPPEDVTRSFAEAPAGAPAAPAALGSHVNVTARGEGEVAGTADAMVVAWRRGTLSVEVEPGQGVSFRVDTDEGRVQVVGTGFDVERGPLGTTVVVRHGRVRVDCVRGGESVLTAGESRVCLPTGPAAALRRILTIQATSASETILEEVDGALGLPGGAGAVSAELLALRCETLVALGRPREAAEAAEVALAHPDVTRAEELHRMAGRLWLDLAECERARPHVEALERLGRSADEPAALRGCEASAPK